MRKKRKKIYSIAQYDLFNMFVQFKHKIKLYTNCKALHCPFRNAFFKQKGVGVQKSYYKRLPIYLYYLFQVRQ